MSAPSDPADPADLRTLLLQLNARAARLEKRLEEVAQATDVLGARTAAVESDFRELVSIVEGFAQQAPARQPSHQRSTSYSWYGRPQSFRTPARIASVTLLASLSLVGAFLLFVPFPVPGDPVRQVSRPAPAPARNTVPVTRPALAVAPASPVSALAAETPALKEPPVAELPAAGTARAPIVDAGPTTSRLDLLLEATEPTWISVTPVGGEKLIDRLLEPGEPAWVKLEGPARVRTGNAGGLLATIGGKPVGPIGPHGRVRELDIYADGTFKVVDRSAVAPAAP